MLFLETTKLQEKRIYKRSVFFILIISKLRINNSDVKRYLQYCDINIFLKIKHFFFRKFLFQKLQFLNLIKKFFFLTEFSIEIGQIIRLKKSASY